MRVSSVPILCGFLLVVLWAAPPIHAEDDIKILEGVVDKVTPTAVFMNWVEYPVVMGESDDYRVHDLVATPEVYYESHEIGYRTIQAVGYITFARLHLRGGKVFRIDILDMEQ